MATSWCSRVPDQVPVGSGDLLDHGVDGAQLAVCQGVDLAVRWAPLEDAGGGLGDSCRSCCRRSVDILLMKLCISSVSATQFVDISGWSYIVSLLPPPSGSTTFPRFPLRRMSGDQPAETWWRIRAGPTDHPYAQSETPPSMVSYSDKTYFYRKLDVNCTLIT